MRKTKRYYLIVTMIILGIIIVTGCQCKDKLTLSSWRDNEKAGSVETKNEKIKPEDGIIYVHVCGAVQTPGVYELPEGSRIFEALEAAGGLASDASANSLNQAQILEDGMQLYISTKKEIKAEKAGEKKTTQKESGMVDEVAPKEGQVNLNTATKEELMTLNGIGASRADLILQYRQEKGEFKKIEDIMKVQGIKEGIFNKIKDQITLSLGSENE